jgi:hypothetical protein
VIIFLVRTDTPPFTPVSKHWSGLTSLSEGDQHGRLLARQDDPLAGRRSPQRASCQVIFGGERKRDRRTTLSASTSGVDDSEPNLSDGSFFR